MENDVSTDPDLGDELNDILALELAAGNKIVKSSVLANWPVIILLAGPFRFNHFPVSERLRYRNFNGRGPWKAHFINLDSGNVLACRPTRPEAATG
jgi:hypothetical protein